jgi:hypothetical protein
MAKKRGRESNVGLIVTLVFFILLALGLGVATYYGFAQQKELTDKATAAAALQKDADTRAEWYQFQALLFRSYLDRQGADGKSLAGMDQLTDPKSAQTNQAMLQTERGRWTSGQIGKDSKGDLPDKAIVTAMINALETKKYTVSPDPSKPPAPATMAWSEANKRPTMTYEDIFKGQQNAIDYLTAQVDAAVKARDEAIAAKTKSEDEKSTADKNFLAEEARLGQVYNDNLDKERKANNTLRDDLTKANKEKDDAIQKAGDLMAAIQSVPGLFQEINQLVQKGDEEKKAIQKSLQAREDKIKELNTRLNDLNEKVAFIQQKAEDSPSNGKPIPTDWRIVRMDRSGKQPFINLGQSDNVKTGMTFSIHSQGPDGKPVAASKGTLEVIDVLKDMSQAQIVSVKDALKDPILPGDFLYNPIFRPSGEQHVVIAGRIDMHGIKGEDDFEEFQRLLKRQNVVVDGYVDPLDGSIKGKMTVGTDYLVLGDLQGVKEAGAASIKDMQNQARSLGVHIIGAREFLESMGYRTP